MPKFAYKAKRPSGEIVEGFLEAESRRLVVAKLQGMKVFPVPMHKTAHCKKLSGEISSLRPGEKSPLRWIICNSFFPWKILIINE